MVYEILQDTWFKSHKIIYILALYDNNDIQFQYESNKNPCNNTMLII